MKNPREEMSKKAIERARMLMADRDKINFICPICEKCYVKHAYGSRHVYVYHLEYWNHSFSYTLIPSETGKKCWCGEKVGGVGAFHFHCVANGGILVHYHNSMLGTTTHE